MKAVKTIVTAAVALNVLVSPALVSSSLAQQDTVGMITKIDRLNGTVAIQKVQDNTVGASSGGPTDEFKVTDGKLLDAVHAGDRVTYATTGDGSSKTITKLQKR